MQFAFEPMRIHAHYKLSVLTGGASGGTRRQLLEGSIGIAKRLQSVAEGVETEEDRQLLREIGCDLVQGWFIARPMAQHQVATWLEQWHTRVAHLVKV